MNDHIFKDYCREYLECSAILNSLKQDSSPDIRAMHIVIMKMDELKVLMKEGLQ